VKVLRTTWEKLGYAEPETVVLRSAADNPERLPKLAGELTELGAGVIIAVGPAAVKAASLPDCIDSKFREIERIRKKHRHYRQVRALLRSSGRRPRYNRATRELQDFTPPDFHRSHRSGSGRGSQRHLVGKGLVFHWPAIVFIGALMGPA
jgi:hypothetical protein